MSAKTTDYDRIITSAPLNRQAATGAKLGRHVETALEQRETLLRVLAGIDQQIAANPEPDERRALGQRRQEIQTQLARLKQQYSRSTSNTWALFVDVARERLKAAEFNEILAEAKARRGQS